jgi:NAD(P)-dependent dehydrogenase (short-subunit alcohol dehydrogenase family)
MHIVMTGATSGFGANAAARLAAAGHDLTIGARCPDAVEAAWRAKALSLDLDDFASIDRFAEAVVAGPPIDALLLNAGLQCAKLETGAAGFERTFAVNQLAHFQLLRRLLPNLAPGARVILTGSGTHDPAEKTPVTPPAHADAERLAFPDRDPTLPKGARSQAFRAYSSSKLANIMTARELARRRPDLASMSFDPGYVPWTGLARASGSILSTLASLILPLLMKSDRKSTVALSGEYLAELAIDPAYADAHGDYWAVRNPALERIEPSVLARDDAACAKLWDDCEGLLELKMPGS